MVNNCVLTGNSNVANGGGSYGGTLNYCKLVGNSAHYGGGASKSKLNNCLLIRNWANTYGGGSHGGTLNGCTVADNSAGGLGGGSWADAFYNCIVYGNTAPGRPNSLNSSFQYSCTFPDPGGTGNITNDPQFVDAAAGNYRLQTNSPCIDHGSNVYVVGTTDLDGNPRIAYGTVDMGAYEAQFPVGYWAWAAAITNGLTNDTDCAAGDGMPNLLKYATGSSPMEPDGLAELGLVSGGVPTLLFNRNPNATDITLVIQGADEMSDAATWRGLATNLNG